MHRVIHSFSLVSVLLLLTGVAPGQTISEEREVLEAQAIANWPAPLLWTPPSTRPPEGARTDAANTVATPLPFIAIAPCRLADTRGNGFAGQYGPPSLVANATRSFTIIGQCGIPVSAAAVSFNFAALNVGAGGDLRVFPAGGEGAAPVVSTLNYNANTPNIANAAVVPLGTGGAITVQADAVSIDLIIDANGYYDNSGLITGVMAGTGLSGGGNSGTVTLNLNFGGSGAASTASRSDHKHGTGDLVSGLLADARLGGTYSNALLLSNPSNSFAGIFSGDGAGLTNVNASQLGGQPASFYQTLAVPPPSRNTVTPLNLGDGRGPSVTIGTDGLGLFGYNDVTTTSLNVAHCSNMACTNVTATPIESISGYPAMTIGADGLGLVSYAASNALKVAHCSSPICSTALLTTLDSAGNVGVGSSVTIGADGLGLISYEDVTNSALKVAHCSDITCGSATLSTLGSVGSSYLYFTSIATGADGLGLISYWNAADGYLHVAHCSDVTCTTATLTTLDTTGIVGQFPSVTIGSDGLGLISYYDATNSVLKTAHCSNLNCTSVTLSTIDTGDVGWYTSVTIGADGFGLISYLDHGNARLKVAHCSNTTCDRAALTIVDSAGSVGIASSITIGGDSFPLIIYGDATNSILKAAHCSNPLCTPFFHRR
jgi:hypothetical protein